MDNLINIRMQTPIEIALGVDENGMTTAKKLYEYLELAPQHYSRWTKTNIIDNEFAEENVDYWAFTINGEWGGQATTDYKLTSRFAKKLSMTQKNVRGEEAREYFTRLEEKSKEDAINRKQLSQPLQMFYIMADEQARQEIELKRQAEQIDCLKKNQQTIQDTFTKTTDKEDFKGWCKKCIAKIAESENFTVCGSRSERYSLAWSESYDRLNSKRPCRLKQRVATAQGEAMQNGASASKAKEINQLTIIASDKDLKPSYELVIKEMMVYYCVEVA